MKASRFSDAQKKAERERLAAQAELLREPQQQAGLFKGSYDEIWTECCPACGCRAFMTGKQNFALPARSELVAERQITMCPTRALKFQTALIGI